MNLKDNFKEEELKLISEAISSQDQDRLSQLSNSVYMNVRKAVARNRNVNTNIINTMVHNERASAVLYWLLKRPTCQMKRELSLEDLENKCVTCEISELQLYSECMTCTQ